MRTRYQNGSVQLNKHKNGPHVWTYRWRERLPNGKAIRRASIIGSVEEYRTKTEALKASEHMRLSANSETPTRRAISFGALVKRYQDDELPSRHSTRLAYTSYLEQHIIPKWSEYSLTRMIAPGAPFMIEEWFKTLHLAPKTKGNIKNVMAVIFDCGMRWGLMGIGASPMGLVRIKNVSRRLEEPRILIHQIQRLIEELPGEPYRTLATLDAVTGLRASELFALRWSDFDWNSRTMLVRRAIVDGVAGEVKTKYSRDGMPLDPAIVEILLRWKAISDFASNDDWVFASWRTNGTLPFRSTAILEDYLKPAAIRAGIGGEVGWHTFRHTFRTLLDETGAPIKVQQELMRHADIRTTMNVYGKAMDESKRQAHANVVRMVLQPVAI